MEVYTLKSACEILKIDRDKLIGYGADGTITLSLSVPHGCEISVINTWNKDSSDPFAANTDINLTVKEIPEIFLLNISPQDCSDILNFDGHKQHLFSSALLKTPDSLVAISPSDYVDIEIIHLPRKSIKTSRSYKRRAGDENRIGPGTKIIYEILVKPRAKKYCHFAIKNPKPDSESALYLPIKISLNDLYITREEMKKISTEAIETPSIFDEEPYHSKRLIALDRSARIARDISNKSGNYPTPDELRKLVSIEVGTDIASDLTKHIAFMINLEAKPRNKAKHLNHSKDKSYASQYLWFMFEVSNNIWGKYNPKKMKKPRQSEIYKEFEKHEFPEEKQIHAANIINPHSRLDDLPTKRKQKNQNDV